MNGLINHIKGYLVIGSVVMGVNPDKGFPYFHI